MPRPVAVPLLFAQWSVIQVSDDARRLSAEERDTISSDNEVMTDTSVSDSEDVSVSDYDVCWE